MAAKMISGVYVIVNTVNGKRYYGSSIDCRTRKRSHWGYLRRGDHTNSHLQRSWNKYGESAFKFILVEVVSVDQLKAVEQKYLDMNACGYNIEPDAQRSGSIRSLETRRKIAATLKGYKRSPDEIAKSAEARRGQYRDPSTNLKVSRGLKRYFKAHPQPSKPKTEEHKRKVSDGLRRYFASNPDAAAASAKRIHGGLTQEVIARRRESIRRTWNGPNGEAMREKTRQRMLGASKKLNASDVCAIVELFGRCKVTDIANRYGVSAAAIYSIVTRP